MELPEIEREKIGRRLADVGRTLRSQLLMLAAFVLLLWLLEMVDQLLLGDALDGLGIRPRQAEGLKGILFMPFLHDGFSHLLANTIPLAVLAGLVMVRGIGDFLAVTAIVMVVGGLGVWLFGPANSLHVGASGLVFGYFGYLILRATFERSLAAVALAVLVIIFYGGLIWGVLPARGPVSWQAHFFGFVGGALAAYWLVKRPWGLGA
jgi:membrane associated rhomboid family serine protease